MNGLAATGVWKKAWLLVILTVSLIGPCQGGWWAFQPLEATDPPATDGLPEECGQNPIDGFQLTYYDNGFDRPLTEVHGRVLPEILTEV